MPVSPPPAGTRLTGLPPVVSDHTALLILGSFPGAASLAAQSAVAVSSRRSTDSSIGNRALHVGGMLVITTIALRM